MVTFWNLPRPLRDLIYRKHLVSEEPVTSEAHEGFMKYRSQNSVNRKLPAICQLSKRAEREAAPIYYGANSFELNLRDVQGFIASIWPRHLKHVHKLTVTWPGDPGSYGHYGFTRKRFILISKCTGLQELNIRVDEAEMVKHLSFSREKHQAYWEPELTPQRGLSILRLPGMSGLLNITGIKHVNFIKRVNIKGELYGGPLPNGPLLTNVLPRLTARKSKQKRVKKRLFPFFDLPPELRNRIYDLVLRINGLIHPSTKPPTTALKKNGKSKPNKTEDHESALTLLLLNRQVYDEAVGVFYARNSFIFYYPTQLHAFLLSIGPLRQNQLRNITMHYYNQPCGGVELADLTFPMLKQLKGLKRLIILMVSKLHESGLRRGWFRWPAGDWYPVPGVATIHGCNPALIPGFKTLFELRGLEHISVKDVELDKAHEDLRLKSKYPNSSGSRNDRYIVKLCKAYEHFNLALADAQKGIINSELLKDNDWQTRDEFPVLGEKSQEDEGEKDASEEYDSEDNESDENEDWNEEDESEMELDDGSENSDVQDGEGEEIQDVQDEDRDEDDTIVLYLPGRGAQVE